MALQDKQSERVKEQTELVRLKSTYTSLLEKCLAVCDPDMTLSHLDMTEREGAIARSLEADVIDINLLAEEHEKLHGELEVLTKQVEKERRVCVICCAHIPSLVSERCAVPDWSSCLLITILL